MKVNSRECTICAQLGAANEKAERLAEELRRRRGNREDVRAQLEREAEAGVKLRLQAQELEWRQKYQAGPLTCASGSAIVAPMALARSHIRRPAKASRFHVTRQGLKAEALA